MPFTPFEVIGLAIAAAIIVGVIVWALRPDELVKVPDRTLEQPILERSAADGARFGLCE